MSEQPAQVELVLLWHHHQPDYRSPRERLSVLPWVRLHAAKDYLDMAERLARHPGVRSTFNFVPSLLDQLEAAAAGYPDALFVLLARDPGSLSSEERDEVLRRCTMAPRHALERWPAYRRMCERVQRARNGTGRNESFGVADLIALETWFLLAWVDPMFHDAPEAAAALAVAPRFESGHRDAMLALHARLVAEVIPAYRRLAESGQIELTESPYYHPILPLLVSTQAARRARPDLTLPVEAFAAPEDATAQVERALARHEEVFGSRPAGMWPPEGSVSPEVAEILARAGVRWAATDEGVLWGSRPGGEQRREALYQPWRFDTPAGSLALFFRDRELSDRIGFVYQNWSTSAAVADFLERIRRIARDHGHLGVPIVTVILDGENCWEHYPDDGGPFLEALYSALEQAPDIRTVTPRQVLDQRGQPAALDRLHSGSWINADFRIWIGQSEKNRAWELLGRARRALIAGRDPGQVAAGVWEALYAAEGSDWFWWFGDDHYTPDKPLFDKLFREHVQEMYERSKVSTPGWLQVPIAPLGMKGRARIQPLGFIHPALDGQRTLFFEWYAAGRYRLGAGGSSMHRGAGVGKDLYLGFDREHLYLRLDFSGEPPGPEMDLQIEILTPVGIGLRVHGLERGEREVTWVDAARRGDPVEGAVCRVGAILELGVPFQALGLAAGDRVEVLVNAISQDQIVETMPGDELIAFTVPDADFESAMWSA